MAPAVHSGDGGPGAMAPAVHSGEVGPGATALEGQPTFLAPESSGYVFGRRGGDPKCRKDAAGACVYIYNVGDRPAKLCQNVKSMFRY